MELQLKVDKQSIYRKDSNRVVADSKNYVTAHFEFSEEWTSPKTALFANDEKVYSVILDENDSCTVPWEVIKPYGFWISVFCGDLITANKAEVRVEESGYREGETPSPPTPDVYSQLMSCVEEAERTAQSVRDDADAGRFDGEKGEQGTPGADGYTPQRGVDYWTEGDKQEIVNDTVSSIDQSGKYAEQATTLSGYGITDAYTKTEIDGKIGSIDAALDQIIALQNTYIGGEGE